MCVREWKRERYSDSTYEFGHKCVCVSNIIYCPKSKRFVVPLLRHQCYHLPEFMCSGFFGAYTETASADRLRESAVIREAKKMETDKADKIKSAKITSEFDCVFVPECSFCRALYTYCRSENQKFIARSRSWTNMYTYTVSIHIHTSLCAACSLSHE